MLVHTARPKYSSLTKPPFGLSKILTPRFVWEGWYRFFILSEKTAVSSASLSLQWVWMILPTAHLITKNRKWSLRQQAGLLSPSGKRNKWYTWKFGRRACPLVSTYILFFVERNIFLSPKVFFMCSLVGKLLRGRWFFFYNTNNNNIMKKLYPPSQMKHDV